MRLFTRTGYRPKRIETKKQNDGLLHLLTISTVGLCACLICLCGVSWAWFTATTSTGTAVIQAATYTVGVSAGENESVGITTESGTTTVTFTDAGSYTITLTPTGTAQNGYCKISYAEGDYYTGQLPTGGELHFTVNADANSELTVTPQWGSYSGTPNLSSGDTIGITTGNTQEPPMNAATTTEPATTTTSAAPSNSPEESEAPIPDAPPADSKTAQTESVSGDEQAPASEDSNQ